MHFYPTNKFSSYFPFACVCALEFAFVRSGVSSIRALLLFPGVICVYDYFIAFICWSCAQREVV